MTQALSIIPDRPRVYIREGGLFTTSEAIAVDFGKAHKDVLRAIDKLSCSDEFRERNFAPTVVSRLIGSVERSTRYFEISKDGFAFLVMGFTGEKSGAFKEAYIAEFNRKRDELDRNHVGSLPNLNDPAFLRQTLLGYTEKVIALEERVVEQRAVIASVQPKAAAWDAFKDNEGLIALSDIGRILGTGPNKTISWLLDKGLVFRMRRGSPLRPMEKYRRKGWFETKTATIDHVERVQTFVTPRGLAEIAELMGRPLDLFGKIDMSRPAQLRLTH